MSTSWRDLRLPALVGALLALTACRPGEYPWQARVPFEDVGAYFTLADVTWFEDEETLFVFYEIEAAQGLSELSQVELSFRTDEGSWEYAPLESYAPVHTHLPVHCGIRTLCGSYSTRVRLRPRDVRLQLRYHRDGELTLEAPVSMHVVGSGAPHEARSAVVYGVLDAENVRTQWRLRHQFPGLRNLHAQRLGLRRDFQVEGVTFGALPDGRAPFADNPYGYGMVADCPAGFQPHDTDVLETDGRAIFDPNELPVASYTEPLVCARATVRDARGAFTTTAFAQKNPEVRPAFPALSTPVRDNTVVRFFLEVCSDPRPPLHRAMQMQRLFLTEGDVLCIDDFATPDFPARLAATLGEAVDRKRLEGSDMVLVMALSRPRNPAVAQAVESALALLVALEADESTPRLSGAFVFDSAAYIIRSPDVSRYVLWCPSAAGGDDLDTIPDTSARSCPLQSPQALQLGEISLSQLPILPTEGQFTTFIERYGVGQTGRMTDLTVRSPMRTTTSTNVPVGDFGVATFFNHEAITAGPTDAFSYCAEKDTGTVVFRVDGVPDIFPLAVLGQVQALFPVGRYELGLVWDFPFLLQLKYMSTFAAAVSLPEEIPFVAAFGIGTPVEQYLGGYQWAQEQFEIGDALLQCTRFCDHPTFSSRGVYNVRSTFVERYSNRCYRPRFPRPGDGQFPPDP